ncbi:hypothetical protein GGR55DRAFT_700946 [Xylaria sp. FL0064]|nr:hypothetical protein GGR55DRAFT_700946 [Xylaria sp. FL0064]
MMLAVQLRQLSKEDDRGHSANNVDEKESILSDTEMAFQQAENMVEVSYHSIREAGMMKAASRPFSDYEENHDSEDAENSQSQQIQIRNVDCSDTATWLYELVFSPAVEERAEISNSECEQSLTPDNSVTYGSRKGSGDLAANSSYARSLVPYRSSSLNQIQSLEQHPHSAPKVVNELLSEWTTLTKGEIVATNRLEQQETKPTHKSESDAVDVAENVLRFEDAIGRRYKIPSHLVRTWKDMEAMINEMFTNVDVFRSLVKAGNYDLLDSRGRVIPRVSWKYTAKPTETYKMVMWIFLNGTSKAGQSNQPKGGKENPRPARKREKPVLSPLLYKILTL